ncbi:hypothetical protein HMPREF1505_1734 [Prevotella sp. ICM33]|nr:hypothetical protein HMPREF1505_1734 [Prevotella sp. ICM33]
MPTWPVSSPIWSETAWTVAIARSRSSLMLVSWSFETCASADRAAARASSTPSRTCANFASSQRRTWLATSATTPVIATRTATTSAARASVTFGSASSSVTAGLRGPVNYPGRRNRISGSANFLDGLAARRHSTDPVNQAHAVNTDGGEYLEHAPRDAQENAGLCDQQPPRRRIGARHPDGERDDDRDHGQQHLTTRRCPVRTVERGLYHRPDQADDDRRQKRIRMKPKKQVIHRHSPFSAPASAVLIAWLVAGP